jgi:hypothetical protein
MGMYPLSHAGPVRSIRIIYSFAAPAIVAGLREEVEAA